MFVPCIVTVDPSLFHVFLFITGVVFNNRGPHIWSAKWSMPPILGSIICHAVYSYKGERIISEIICACHYKWRRSCYLAIRDNVRIRRRNCNLARARATNIATNKYRIKNKEWLGPRSVRNLGPRLSKCKLVKTKRNRPNRGCKRDREESR